MRADGERSCELPGLDPALEARSGLLGLETRLSLIAGALIGARDLAEGLGAGSDGDLARSILAAVLKVLALRNTVRGRLERPGGPGPRPDAA